MGITMSETLQGGAGGLKHGLVETDLDVAEIGTQRNVDNQTTSPTLYILGSSWMSQDIDIERN